METNLLEASDHPFHSFIPENSLKPVCVCVRWQLCGLELMKAHLLEASDHRLRSIMGLLQT